MSIDKGKLRTNALVNLTQLMRLDVVTISSDIEGTVVKTKNRIFKLTIPPVIGPWDTPRYTANLIADFIDVVGLETTPKLCVTMADALKQTMDVYNYILTETEVRKCIAGAISSKGVRPRFFKPM